MSIDKLKDIIKSSDNIVFFGGAGVSTESNIPDFRSANGLYNEDINGCYSPEEILSHTFFMKHTKDFFDFYKGKMIYKDAKPNSAHFSLAELEKLGKLKAVITQNIDGLHQMAGSKNVLELHGSIYRNYCMRCGHFFDLEYIINTSGIPKCNCGGIIKPDVVLYEESLNDDVIETSIYSISKANVLIIGGTSLSVYPASGLVKFFSGKHLILINKTSTPYDDYAEIVINDSVGKTLKSVCPDTL